MFGVPNKFRITEGPYGSNDLEGNQGAFLIPLRTKKSTRTCQVIASDGAGWEHVSVSLPDRTPTWEEMCIVKSMFWEDCDAVVQFHPPKSEYVNNHKYCLHMWRENGINPKLPDSILVGLKQVS